MGESQQNGTRYVTWKDAMQMVIVSGLSAVTISLGILAWVMNSHNDHPHKGTVGLEEWIQLRQDIREINTRLHTLGSSIRTGDNRINVGEAGPPSRPLSTSEMASFLDVSPNTVIARGQRGELAHYRDSFTGHYVWKSPTMTDADWLSITESNTD